MRHPTTQRLARARTAPLPLLAAAAAVALALLGASCGGATSADAEDAAPETTSTTAAPTTPTTTLTDEEQVEAKYREMWAAVIEANDPPDPTSPVLAASMTGMLLDQATTETRRNLEAGTALRLPDNSISDVARIRVVRDGAGARIEACVLDDAVLYDRRSGLVLNDRVVSGATQATAVATPDGWRIATNGYTEKIEGVTGCS